MRRLALSTFALLSAAIVLSGCGPRQEDPRISELIAENAALRAENDDLRARGSKPAIDPATQKGLEAEGVTVTSSAEGVTLTLPGKILFASGSAALQPGAKRALDQAVKVVQDDQPGAEVYVQGHTDSQPIKHSKWRDNQHLSEARAQAVAGFLTKSGVSARRVTVQGFGSSKAVAGNKTAKGRALNRRVDIFLKVAE